MTARTWDFPIGAGSQAQRRSFFEQSSLADVYAARIGRPRLRAQPLKDEWRQTLKDERNGVRERGWRVVGSWHRTSSAMAAPLTHQLLLNTFITNVVGHLALDRCHAPGDSDPASFEDSGPLSPRLGKKAFGDSFISTTASSSNRLHLMDDLGEHEASSPAPWSPCMSHRSCGDRRTPKLGNIAESHPASTAPEECAVPRELTRVVSAMISGKEGDSIASAAGQVLMQLRASGGLEHGQIRDDSSPPKHARHAAPLVCPRKVGQWAPIQRTRHSCH